MRKNYTLESILWLRTSKHLSMGEFNKSFSYIHFPVHMKLVLFIIVYISMRFDTGTTHISFQGVKYVFKAKWVTLDKFRAS